MGGDGMRREVLIVAGCQAGLIAVAGLAAWSTREPLIFASLGPTAFELIETPTRATARPYNIIGGHLIGVLAGFTGLYLAHAAAAPVPSPEHVALARVGAAVLAAMFTVLGTLLARAGQPAAISTALLISLGGMQTPRDGALIMVAVCLMTLVGEPLRRWRAVEMLANAP